MVQCSDAAVGDFAANHPISGSILCPHILPREEFSMSEEKLVLSLDRATW
jgi:hypothetical protein